MDEPLYIAVCEDSKEDCEKLTSILDKSDIKNEYTVFSNAEDFLASYRIGDYDLLLTDIYMGGMTGVESVTKLREIDDFLPIAFLTTSQDFALESYRLSVTRYIEKPYRDEAVEEMLRIARLKKETQPSLEVFLNRKEIKVPINSIVYLEQHTRDTFIHLKCGEPLEIHEKLSFFYDRLNEKNFFFPHKSFCVNLKYVKNISTELKCFVMPDNAYIPIKRELMGKAKTALQEFLFDRTRGIN